MTTLTKAHVLKVARRAFGPDYARAVEHRLPERLDLDKTADTALLSDLGLSPDHLFSALGGEY